MVEIAEAEAIIDIDKSASNNLLDIDNKIIVLMVLYRGNCINFSYFHKNLIKLWIKIKPYFRGFIFKSYILFPCIYFFFGVFGVEAGVAGASPPNPADFKS